MRFPETQIQTKDGRTVCLRSPVPEDSAALLSYLKATAAETRFLMSEPEEIRMTLKEEEEFLKAKLEHPREVLICAFLDGTHIGNCSICAMGDKLRYRHRCSIAIALYRRFWGLGIGRQMMESALRFAQSQGYEQAELEVVTENHAAVRLYQNLGFSIYGTRKHDMKYADGSYGDVYLMARSLLS